ncbi:unnamed protein product [Diamesa hyperborea]
MECVHFQNYLAEFNLDSYKLVSAYFSATINKEARKRKAFSCLCYTCGKTSTIVACLHCIFFGCKAHFPDHFKSQNKHYIALQLAHGMLYCHLCQDYIYNDKCSKINEKNLYRMAKSLKKNVSFRPWFPSNVELSLLLQNPKRLCSDTARIGLRGLLNLGSTCFMNCIVQVLIHTPILRDYFLSDRHNCDRPLTCLVCEVSKLFQEFYSSEKGAPISLHGLLHLIWNNARHLAGYEQQDAHEFFIATLDLLHTHCKNAKAGGKVENYGSQQHSGTCNCIIDEIFTGELQSDVVCQKCKGVSTTIDPFWDISLDLGHHQGNPKSPKSLVNCLERFTRREHLGANAKIKCSQCFTYQESTKELSMCTLPIVASFHLKRFEHSSLYDKKKISTFISFPAELDMRPFLSKSDNEEMQSGDYRYCLYAVVNHLGSIDAGHYTAYVRHKEGIWIKCDDHNLTTVSLNQVLDSEGYLLFYHKKYVEYN